MNPVGSGWCPGNLADGAPAPQIEAVEIPVTSPETRYTPQGFGPIPPAWLPRRALGGTYDQDWIDHVWPNWPSDYDFRYHNSAHPDLQAPRHLEGALLIELENLHPERPVWRFSVPDERLVAIAAAHDGSVQVLEMVRDTVFLDIGEAADDDPRLLSVWRTPFDLLTTRGLTLRLIPADRFSAMAAQRLSPADCACDPALLNGEAA
jgi:hypothetical protein